MAASLAFAIPTPCSSSALTHLVPSLECRGSTVVPIKLQATSRRSVATRAGAVGVSEEEPAGLVLVDHYRRLGVSPDASNAQIVKAFEAKCLELTEGGVQGGVDEEAARQRLQDLEVSLDVLTSEEARRLYDWGLERAQRAESDEYVWPFETDLTQKNYTPGVGRPPRPMVPVDDEGVANIGYFFLAWFLLSAVLSCTLK